MFKESSILNSILNIGRKLVPRRIFKWAQPIYHWGLGMLGAVIYGFPSHSMRVIAVTGTKGKSTTVFMITKIFEDQGLAVAAVGSLGFKIRGREWPNNLKMTLPGRMKLQKFLFLAKRAGCKYVVLEATSEGIVQNRLVGVCVDCAVFTNLHREHIESHGSFENYMAAKQKLFLKTRNTHVLNIDHPYYEKFANFPAHKKVTYGKEFGNVSLRSSENLEIKNSFKIENLKLKILGSFNMYNALAALAVASVYGLDLNKAAETLNKIESIPGRMEIIRVPGGFDVVIDYAHTPESLIQVYQTLKSQIRNSKSEKNLKPRTHNPKPRLVCVLGAAGGGRDKWKRPEFGRIAAEYCDEIILTNEDPYDENPLLILEQIESGFSKFEIQNSKSEKCRKILDRKEAIKTAMSLARAGDIVAITGKGSETSIAVAGGREIPWSDKEVVLEVLQEFST